jgi:Ras-related protein Rab-1A
MGFDYYSKDEIINNKKERIKKWDTAGQERFRSLTASFFTNSQGIMICFDVTSQTTFFNLKFWIDSLINNLGTNHSIQIIIVRNKIDLKSKREVSFEDADKFCLDNTLPYFEYSAKEGINVKKSILFLVERILDFSQEDLINRDSFNIR